ncbi:hypothetical protein V494_02635 [Pseudogymnoascus sp. VKM F-4513 (FW-928)]|nr:hypothetical protein V494_02635 [Pseudogymnoascus sp. VKM F-4513 (FW-928)]
MGGTADMQLPSLKELQTGEQMELLNIVDSLRAEGLSEITALPQLIVCGDQSSGKSSVLEAISGIPFPRKENTCTRFATEVILRRSPDSRISVSVVPSRDRRRKARERLLKFRHQLSTPDDFPDLFDKAKDAMLNVPGKSFSKDILRIEFCGPSQPQLTLVDLPGLIHSHIEAEQQTSEDVELVTELVSDYLKSPRSIILAIVSAKYDINVQAILNRARAFEVDPEGIRTMGIITKPDTLVKGSELEDSFIKLAKNERVKFRLGWHVVKNLDSALKESLKSSLETRNAEEKAYFKDSTFKSVPSHSVGIESLRTKLSKVLFNQIRLELPRLVDDIEQRIINTKAARDRLGPSRTSTDDQRAFLIQLSQTFQTICQAAIRGDYDNDFFRSDELLEKGHFERYEPSEKRLCANLMNKHFGFADELRKNGCQWTIEENYASAKDFASANKSRNREAAIADACRLLKRSRGRELPGLPNPLLVGELFREYSRPWETLARAHIKNAWDMTNKFIELVLTHLTDGDVCDKILRLWLDPIMAQKLEAAYGKLEELLEVHKEHPFTTNHHFMDNRKKLQQKGTKDEIQQQLKSIAKPGQMVSVDDITNLMKNLDSKVNADMDMLAAEDAYDNMMAYYKVAMKLFMDNVPTLAIQAPIVRKLDEVLCPTTVFRMPLELVTKIAGESEEKMQERNEILSKLSTLEAGAQICRQYAMRPQSCEYATTSYGVDKDINILAATTSLKAPPRSPTVPLNPTFGAALFENRTPPKGTVTGGLFGSTLTNSSSRTSNIFGSETPSKSLFGSGFGSGSAAPDATSSPAPGTRLFGSSNSGCPGASTGGSGFGSGSAAPDATSSLAPGTRLFGSSNSGGLGASTGGSGFGASTGCPGSTGYGGFGGFGETPLSQKSQTESGRKIPFLPPAQNETPKPTASSVFERSKNTEAKNDHKSMPWRPILPVVFTMGPSDNRLVIEPTAVGQQSVQYRHISAMPVCEEYSVEELRLSDYTRGEDRSYSSDSSSDDESS